MQTFDQICSYLVSFIGTIDFWHFKWFLLTLFFAGSPKVSRGTPFFQQIRMKFDVALKKFKLNIQILHLPEIGWVKENSCSLTHFVPQTRISRFDHDVASADKRETLVLDQYFRFCVPSVGVTAPS